LVWETLIETIIEPEDLEVVSAMVEAVEASVEADLDETTEAHAKCLKRLAVTVAKTVKFLLDRQTANRFTVPIVLKKWAMAAGATQGVMKDQVLDPKLQFLHQTIPSLKP
jgi:hypothetical protein